MVQHLRGLKFWRQFATFTLIGLLVVSPLPRHWPLLGQEYAHVYYELTHLSLYISDLLILILLAAAVPWLRQTNQPSALHPLAVPLSLLTILTAASSVWAFDATLAWQQAVRLLFLLALFLIVVWLRPQPRQVQLGLAAVVTLQASVAWLQFVRQNDLGLRWLGELDLMTQAGGDSILFSTGQYWLRGYGLTPHPNILGGVLALSILALIPAYLAARPVIKPAWLALLLLGLLGSFVSFSRAAWLGGLVGGLFGMVLLLSNESWRKRYGRSLFILVLAAGLLLGVLGWQQRHLVLARFTPTSSGLEIRAVNERAALMDAGLELFRLAPITGIGAGNTAVAILPLVKDIPSVSPQPVHNTPWLLAIELGLPGALLWLWLMFFPVVWALHRWRENRLSLWGVGLTAALLAFAVIDLFDYYAWGWQQGRLLRWLYLGLWASAVNGKQLEE